MKSKELAPGVIVGDYRAERDGSLLAWLDTVSAQRSDGGLLHGGHIHFIQEKLSDEDDMCFLKAAISGVLDDVPTIWPLNLPEQVERGTITTLSDEQQAALRTLNGHLLLPIDPHDVLRVITAATEYLALSEKQHS